MLVSSRCFLSESQIPAGSGFDRAEEEAVMGDGFDISFKALPPDLQMKLWVLALDANTSKVNLAYKPGSFTTSLGYNYGGNVEASLSLRRDFSTTLGVNPANGNVDLGMIFRGFNFGTSANFTQKSVGMSLSYGTKLLPFPSELAGVFDSAAGGLQSMAGDIRSAPNNPLAWYKLHSDDAATISKAVSTGQQISKMGNSFTDSLGAGIRLNYDKQKGFTIYGGVQFKF
jgi:hypothetical protein